MYLLPLPAQVACCLNGLSSRGQLHTPGNTSPPAQLLLDAAGSSEWGHWAGNGESGVLGTLQVPGQVSLLLCASVSPSV